MSPEEEKIEGAEVIDETLVEEEEDKTLEEAETTEDGQTAE